MGRDLPMRTKFSPIKPGTPLEVRLPGPMREQVSAQQLSGCSNDRRSKSRIVKAAEVIARTGFSKSKIYRDMKAGKFPQQATKLEGSTSAGWFEEDIDNFLDQLRPGSNLESSQQPSREAHQGGTTAPDGLHPIAPRLRPGTSPLRHSRKTEQAETLIRTGMKMDGREVLCHLPSRQLLVAVGTLSPDFLAAIGGGE